MKRMIACFCAALLAFFAAACSQSDDKSLQTTTASTTAATTVSAAVSGDIGAKLDKIISDDEYEGLVYITKDGAPVYESYTGTDESGKTLSADTTMLIGSVSKQFCAAAVLMLRDEGKLSVDDTLDKYFPDFTKGKNITLKNLLSMRSGIADMVNQGSVEGISPDKTDAENTALVKDWIFNHELLADPGTVYAYSNSNYFLLGNIVEQVSGQTYHEFIQKRIFDPLKMTGSGFTDDIKDAPAWADGRDLSEIYNNTPSGLAKGAGDIASTAVDMDKWMTAISSGKLISEQSYSEMTTDYSTDSGEAYGYGMTLMQGGAGHSGAIGNYFSKDFIHTTLGYHAFFAANDSAITDNDATAAKCIGVLTANK